MEKSNACFRKTLEDAEIYNKRRERVVSDCRFDKDGKTLFVLTNKDRCLVLFMPAGCDIDWSLVTDNVTSEPDAEIWFEFQDGRMDLRKRKHTTPACLAFRVVSYFLETGEKAPFVTWLDKMESKEQ